MSQEIDIDTLIDTIERHEQNIQAMGSVIIQLQEEVERLKRHSCPCEMRFA